MTCEEICLITDIIMRTIQLYQSGKEEFVHTVNIRLSTKGGNIFCKILGSVLNLKIDE